MNVSTKEPQDLFKHINILIGFHCAVFFTGLLDLFFISYSSEDFSKIQCLFDFYRCLQCSMKSEKGTLISSILVVWAFITAVLVFYLEKKDNLYFGSRIWDIASHTLSKRQKKIITVIFFLELGIILLGTVINYSLLLLCLIPLYTFTAFYVLKIVIYATSSRSLEEYLLSAIRDEISQKERPFLQAFLSLLPTAGNTEITFLKRIVIEAIVMPVYNRNEEPSYDQKKAIYTVMESILEMLRGNDLKIPLIHELGSQLSHQEGISKEIQLEMLGLLACPMLEKIDKKWGRLYIEFVSFISKSDFREQLFLKGIVFSFYLEKSRADDYNPVKLDILNNLDVGQLEMYTDDLLRLTDKLNRTIPNKNDAVEFQAIMEWMLL